MKINYSTYIHCNRREMPSNLTAHLFFCLFNLLLDKNDIDGTEKKKLHESWEEHAIVGKTVGFALFRRCVGIKKKNGISSKALAFKATLCKNWYFVRFGTNITTVNTNLRCL